MREVDADRMDEIEEEEEMLPEVSIKIPLRVPPLLLPLMCDKEQHQNDLRESVRNLIIQVGLVALLSLYSELSYCNPQISLETISLLT